MRRRINLPSLFFRAGVPSSAEDCSSPGAGTQISYRVGEVVPGPEPGLGFGEPDPRNGPGALALERKEP